MEFNQTQVKNVLQYIEKNQNEEVKKEVFCELGRQCYMTRKIKEWVEGFNGDVQAFIDRVNIDHKSPYWEKFAFSEDRSILYLTGKVVDKCACVFAECADPPLSLCRHCCKAFQENIFSTLFGCNVEVEITEGFLLGDNRCSTAIHIGNREGKDRI